ncbi:MAG: tRNA (adenosine(37)-N6)-threonylcarbamoyltransferase complex dimerization subunit type 1 TsaB [Dehalococcoidia bacterium]
MELAVDTSTNTAGVALSDQGTILSEITWQTNHNHTVELIPEIIELLEEQKLVVSDISAITVARGPGSFNGLRVGLAVAKGLAFALGIGLVGIGTLEAAAFACADYENHVCAILPAGRGEIASATFQKQGSNWQKLSAEHITTIESLCERIVQKTVFCGEISREQREQLKEKLGEKAYFPQETAIQGRAGCLAKLGWCRIENGDFGNPATLQPLYLRKPSITKPRRRKNDAMSNMRTGMQ